MEINYLVAGTGALGSVFGGFLLKAGKNVTFLGQGEHFDRVLKNGIKIDGLWGEHHFTGIKGYYPDEVHKITDKFDVILLCVKSNITNEVVNNVSHMLKPEGLCISVQNGLGNIEEIASVVGENRTVGGRIIFGVEINTPGIATVSVYADKVLFGSMHPDINRKLLNTVISHLDKSGIPTSDTDNITGYIWAKALYNCALNPLSAILGVTYGELANDKHTREMMKDIIREVYAVAGEKNVKMLFKTPAEYISYFLEKLIPPTRKHHSSMYQDLKNKRKTEIDSLTGAIVNYAGETKVNVLANTAVYRLLKFKENQLL